MKSENFNNTVHKPRVLVAPLDWGLGHATRCIPIINKLLQQNCEVIIASEGAVKFLLQQEFPMLSFLNLKGYRVQYSRKKIWMPAKLLLQVPKIILGIYTEHAWLKKMVKLYSIDAVISDNRFGMYHSFVPCIYITHQLKIKTGNRFTEPLVQKTHYWFINKYKECWVPDIMSGISLAGELSHPVVLPEVPVKYIGPLSRFEKNEAEIKYDLAIILSGPEPQRTVFEKKVLKDLKLFSGKTLLVRGLPANTALPEADLQVLEIYNHLPASALNQVILQSKMIVSRCGYSTVMDLIKLKKNAILVPTPGQTEQEYLSGYLYKQHFFLCVHQDLFSLSDVLKRSEHFSFNNAALPQNDHEKVIENFILSLR